jgi:hypothetical protein
VVTLSHREIVGRLESTEGGMDSRRAVVVSVEADVSSWTCRLALYIAPTWSEQFPPEAS